MELDKQKDIHFAKDSFRALGHSSAPPNDQFQIRLNTMYSTYYCLKVIDIRADTDPLPDLLLKAC